MSDREWCENIVLPHRPLLRIFSKGTRSFWAAPELFSHLAALEYPNRAIGIPPRPFDAPQKMMLDEAREAEKVAPLRVSDSALEGQLGPHRVSGHIHEC